MSEQIQNNTSANKRIARNSIFMSIRMVVVLLIAIYTTRVVLSALGVEDYGIYNVVCGFVALFGFLSNAMNNGIQRYYNFEIGKSGKDGLKRVYNAAIRVQGIMAFVLIILIEAIGLWYINYKMVIPTERLHAALWVFHCSMLSFVLLILQVPYSAAIIAEEKMDFYAIVSVLNSILNLLVAIIIKNAPTDKLQLYGILLLLVNLLVTAIYYCYSHSLFPSLKIERVFDIGLSKSMLGFSGWNLFGAFGGIMKDQGVNMILNLFCGPIVNAARGVAVQVNGGLQGFVVNLHVATRPQVTKSYAQGDFKRVLALTFSISKLSSLALFVLSYPVLLEIHYILGIWLGDNVPEHTEAFILIIILTSYVNNLNTAVSGIVHSSGKMKTYQLAGAVVSLSCLPFIYICLGLKYSAEFALLITFVDSIFVQICALIILKGIIEYRYLDYIKKVILPFFLVVIISIPLPYYIHISMQEGIMRFFIVGVFSVIEILVISYLAGLNNSEKALVNNIIAKKIKRK